MLKNLNLKNKKFSSLQKIIHEKISDGNEDLTWFFLSNLVKDNDVKNSWRWRVNMDSICLNYLQLLRMGNVNGNSYAGEVMVIKAKRSGFIPQDRISEFHKYFINFDQEKNLIEIDCGHWVHYEKPNEFASIIEEFDRR